jgi:putative FmdB family regulatory protein
MPIYEYRCSACGEKFEKLVRGSSGQQEINCPSCNADRVERLVSTFGFSSSSSGAASYGSMSSSGCGTSFGG